MFGLKRKKNSEPTEETPMMGYVDIRGIGKVEVDSMPTAIPSHVMIGNKRVKINKNLYLWLWANLHGTKEGQKRLSAIL